MALFQGNWARDDDDIHDEVGNYIPAPWENKEDEDVIKNHMAKFKQPPHSVEQACLGISISIFNVNPNMFNDGQVYYANRKHFTVPADKIDAYLEQIRKFIASL